MQISFVQIFWIVLIIISIASIVKIFKQKEFSVGTDQTCLNYLLRKHKITLNILPQCYNLQDLFKKNFLFTPGYSWWQDHLIHLYYSGYVYHFNAIPPDVAPKRDSNYWMERVYIELYEAKK